MLSNSFAIDERPEEVTDMQRTVKGDIGSTFDEPFSTSCSCC